jgi:deoxycytidylate deaminase
MLILGVGIARVVCEKKYRGGVESENMLTAGGVQIEHVNSDVEKYKNQ